MSLLCKCLHRISSANFYFAKYTRISPLEFLNKKRSCELPHNSFIFNTLSFVAGGGPEPSTSGL